MKHIAKVIGGRYVHPLCGADTEEGQVYVEAAMQSDCDDCRVIVGVAHVGDKSCDGRTFGVKEAPSYTPGPPLCDARGIVYERKK